MEDALALYILYWGEMKIYNGLNPCFNGRCTRTDGKWLYTVHILWVLILVLMEDALALHFKGNKVTNVSLS